ncbi:MAG: enoyl-CoA hydratase/isomerase family protein [Nitrososphaerota archaeon]|nr:enoyl-CoA hydratase/isomerase family protein [Nitrososphaerota archaeon]
MPEYGTIRYAADGGIRTVVLNRPRSLNAINTAMLKELGEVVDACSGDPGARVLIVKGEGGNFSAGADVKERAEHSESPDARRARSLDYLMLGHDVFGRLMDLPLPVIAQVEGYCLGGGLELALRCDVRIASEDAKLGLPEARVGVFPAFGGTQVVPRFAGPGRAKYLMFTGEHVGGRAAMSMGLVDEVVRQSEVEGRTSELARKVAQNAPLALRHIKSLVNRSLRTPPAEGMLLEINSAYENMSSDDFVEGAKAFAEKRKPEYRGR